MTKRAIFYLTYNGIFNNTNGVGTQTKTFLEGIDRYYARFQKEFGDFSVHLVGQAHASSWWGYSEKDISYARDITSRHNGSVHFCDFGSDEADFWTTKSWEALSLSAARYILSKAHDNDQVLVIANDIPFLHTPSFLEEAKKICCASITSLIALYGTSYIHTKPLDTMRLAWEQEGLETPKHYKDVKLGKYSEFMYNHFIEKYHVDPLWFIPYTSSLIMDSPDFAPMPGEDIVRILKENDIPLDKPFLFAFGRADRVKGFDILLNNVAKISPQVHVVLNVVPYSDDDPILNEYRAIIQKNKLSATLRVGFSRELPHAVCQWPNTKIVVCPSRGEPLSNIPFEVSLWAKSGGPVLLCANRDGYKEQIKDGFNGFLFDSLKPKDMSQKATNILSLSQKSLDIIQKNAYDEVVKKRDFYTNFHRTLQVVWK